MSSSSPRRVLDEKGFSLISLLLVVMILGIMMALTLESLNGTGLTSSGTGGSSTTLSIPKGAGDVVAQAQISACEADFSSVETAIVTYYSDNGKPPGAGTTWATHNPYGSPIMQSWPSERLLHSHLEWHRAQRDSSIRPRVIGLDRHEVATDGLLRRVKVLLRLPKSRRSRCSNQNRVAEGVALWVSFRISGTRLRR